MLEQIDMGIKPSGSVKGEYYFVYSGYLVLSKIEQEKWSPLSKEEWEGLGLTPRANHYAGAAQQMACYAVEMKADIEPPIGYEWLSLKHLLINFDDTFFALAGRGIQLVEWHRSHQFCGECGKPLQEHISDRARSCHSCERHFYPRLSPCVIVLITQGEKLLLARGERHPEGWYSTLAGFIEPGETVEQALHREIKEEVGIQVKNLEYQGSQPWPFPHQLMLGFYAEYKSGELNFEDDEISDAKWFHYQDLPPHPPESSISGQLIRDYVKQLKR